jgi:uncharacterized protein
VVHITPSLEGMPIEDYSMQVAEAWRIGQKGSDNGVILTIAPNEREIRIEAGYGLEGVLPDAIAARIIREQITPAFRDGDMDGGVVAGVRAIMAVTEGEPMPLPARRREAPAPWWVTVLLVIALLTLPVWLRAIAAANRGPGWGTSYRGPYRRGGWGGGFGGGGFGGGGFGGGGFSGGGGGFGGGGASGRW